MRAPACIFRNDSGAIAEIDDGGGQYLGQQFCAAFAGSQGWLEDTQAEQARAQKAQAAQQAQQQKQQRADAIQQAKQSVVNAASTVTDDVQGAWDRTRPGLQTIHCRATCRGFRAT
jgi:ABC-type transport system involved in cytochrome bd biosynthesis fused ATPase/permease subunit